MDYIAYIRPMGGRTVTAEEDLARQREELNWWLEKSGGQLVAEYVAKDRAGEGELVAEALKECRKRKARLVIPSLIRTGQAKTLIDALIGARAQFVVIHVKDEPTRRLVDTLNDSAKREQERRAKRAKESLGTRKVGNPHGTRADGTPALTQEARAKGCEAAAKVKRQAANAFAAKMQPIIRGLMEGNKYDPGMTQYAVAKELNRRRVETASGTTGNWTGTKVSRVLAWEVTEEYKLKENFFKGWKSLYKRKAWHAENDPAPRYVPEKIEVFEPTPLVIAEVALDKAEKRYDSGKAEGAAGVLSALHQLAKVEGHNDWQMDAYRKTKQRRRRSHR